MNNTQLLEIGIQKKLKQTNLSWQDIAEQHSDGKFANGEVLRLWVKNELKKSGQLKSKINITNVENEEIENIKNNFTETSEIKSDGTHKSTKLLELSNEELKDPNFILNSHGYDPKTWELFSSSSKKWHVYSKIDKIQTLYASSITARPRKDELTVESIKELFGELSNNFVSIIHNPTRYSDNGKMLEVNVTDLHLAKLGSLDANDIYNEHIAKERFFKIINGIIDRTQGIKFEKVLFVWQNDFFHVDNLANSTTAGTRQDVTMKLNEMFKMGTEMLVQAIDLLSTIAPVHSCYIGANHDRLMSYFATEYLAAWFRNNPNVTIDADPKIRKYIEFGKCLIGLTHGHAEGKRVKHVMPVEAPEAWGRTIYREIHQGHIHSEKAYIVEENGIIVRNLSSPSGNDTWHFDSAYVGSIRKSQNFIWDKENGLEAILNISF